MSDLEKMAMDAVDEINARAPATVSHVTVAPIVLRCLLRATEGLRSELEQVRVALDNVGCPIGNEHKSYTQPERIAGLGKSSQYFMAQTDQLRSELADARRLLAALHELARPPQGDADCYAYAAAQELTEAFLSAQTKEAR